MIRPPRMPPSTTVDRKPKSRVVCTVRFEESDVAPAEQLALERLGTEVEIKGFRKGMAPMDMVRSRIPQEQLFEETVRVLLQPLIPSLLQEHTIQPVVAPKVEVVSRFPLSIKFLTTCSRSSVFPE